ncbi:MAG: CatA-like O-acetyltransferase [Lutibacter sp.]|uniref:CatA-like O-acetyltransferase n=1 Tax=Lutibacter sp. TaxID=1925666 RepID=UPI00385CAE86
MKKFDIDKWNRKTQFNFFKEYEDPFFNLTANLEVTNLYVYCKKHKLSFSLACLYVALKAMNEIMEFKLRFKNGEVYLFDELDIGSTILNDNETFSFCYFENQPNLIEFIEKGKVVIENHHKKVEKFEPKGEGLNLVHCTTLPWVSFTSFKHARNGDERTKGIPKIVFGKLFDENNLKKIPFSVEVHHALMDGVQVGILYKKMQEYIHGLV